MAAFPREVSLMRSLVPFQYRIAGPVATVAKRVFHRYPYAFTNILSTLEETDTAAQPRMMLAEAYQALAGSDMPQREIRELFRRAEDEARAEFTGKYDARRLSFDPEYRLNVCQLHMSAGWWHRMLMVSPRPWEETNSFTHTRYAADMRKDPVISPYVDMLRKDDTRQTMTDDIEDLIKDLFVLERDLYGEHRLDKRGDQMFLVQGLLMSEMSKSPETARGFYASAVQEFGNLLITETNVANDRWRQVDIVCKPEEEPVPWYEIFEMEEVAARSHSAPSAPIAKTPEEKTLKRDVMSLLLDGEEFDNNKVRVFFDAPIVPRRVSEKNRLFRFELANEVDDASWWQRSDAVSPEKPRGVDSLL